MKRKEKKWLSYVLSLAVLATAVLPGEMKALAATLKQDDQTLQFEVDEQGNKVYTLTQDLDKGFTLSLEGGETVRINGNGHTIKGQDGIARRDGEPGSQRAAEEGLCVFGNGTVIVKDITLIGGGGDQNGYNYRNAAGGMRSFSNVIFEGNVKIMAGETAERYDGSDGMSFSGGSLSGPSYPQMTVKKGAKVTIQGGDGGRCEIDSSKGGQGMRIITACLQVEKQAQLLLIGGRGSDGAVQDDFWDSCDGGKGGNALYFSDGRIDAYLQETADTKYGTLSLSPGAGGAPSDPTTATTGAIGRKINFQTGYVYDKKIVEDYSSELKKVTVRHQLVDESGNLSKVLDERDYYTRQLEFRYGDPLRFQTEKTQGCQITGIKQLMQDGSLESMTYDTPITDGATVIDLCQCEHTSGVYASDSEEDTYLCNICDQKMHASITDSDGNTRYLTNDCISDDLINSAKEGDTIRLLGKNGTCGDDLRWYLAKETSADPASPRCKLTIEGTGIVKGDSDDTLRPWVYPSTEEANLSYVSSIEIKSGVAKVEEGAFKSYTNLEEVTLANGIEVEANAFQDNASVGRVAVLADKNAASDLTKEGLVQAGLSETADYTFPVVFEGNNQQDEIVEYYGYGDAVTPAAITYSGYTVQGWYTDAAFSDESKWNLETDRVMGAMTLYAKWKADSKPSSTPVAASPEVTTSPDSGLSETPSPAPTSKPEKIPSPAPTSKPEKTPSPALTSKPEKIPSPAPTLKPEKTPDPVQTSSPSVAPTKTPGSSPIVIPSQKPGESSQTTVEPGTKPTEGPTVTPDSQPTLKPTAKPGSKTKAKPASKGKKIKDSKTGVTYKVISSNAKKPKVSYYACPSQKSRQKKIVIQKQVTIKGVTYEVTAIAPNAFKGNKRLTSITIGKNISSIGKNAFRGCRKLKQIIIQSDKLTMKSVGKNAFLNISKTAVVQTAKNLTKKYRKVLKKKGMPKAAKVIAYK